MRSENISTGDIAGQQIRGELNSVKITLNPFGHHFDGARFSETRGTLNQEMTIGKNGNEEFFNEISLANNLLTQPGFKTGDCSLVHESITYSDVTQ